MLIAQIEVVVRVFSGLLNERLCCFRSSSPYIQLAFNSWRCQFHSPHENLHGRLATYVASSTLLAMFPMAGVVGRAVDMEEPVPVSDASYLRAV